MARTLQWTGAHDEDSANALNWNDLTNGLDPAAAPPGAGDTEIIGFGTAVAPLDATLNGNLIEVGGSTGATVAFSGDGVVGLGNPTVDAASTIDNQVPDETLALQTVLDALGTFVNQGRIVADGPAGSQFTIAIGQNGALPGFFINQGTIESEVGNTLSIVVGRTSEVFNPGLIIDNGGSLLITTSGAGQIVGGYAPVLGLVEIEAGGTTEFNAALPSTAGGTKQYFDFEDGANDLLKIDQIGQFSAVILGFGAGDTIDLGPLPSPITSVTVGADSVLALSDSSGVVASLVLGGNHPIGTFAVVGGIAAGFTFSAAGPDTLITTGVTSEVWTSFAGTNLWTSGSNWASGTPPGATEVAVIGDGNTQGFTVSTGVGTVSVGNVTLNDPNATLEVANSLVVLPPQENTVQDIAGTVQVDSGATLSVYAFRQFLSDSNLDLLAGSSLDVLGRPTLGFTSNGTIPVTPGDNFGVVLEGSTTVDGATLNAGPTQNVAGATGGDILVGEDGAGTPAQVIVENAGAVGASVSDTFSVLYSAPTSFGALTISGAQTDWTDAGDPTDTENTRGYMLIGDNPEAVNTPAPPYAGAAQLTVESGATLTEAAYANIANSIDSAGSVVVTSSAHWNIGNTTTTGTPIGFLQVGFHGTGSLLIDDGGQVAVGAGGTIVSGGVQEVVTWSMEIGNHAGASGALTVDGTGSQLTTLNAVRDGDIGVGTFSVQNSASAFIGGYLDLGGSAAGRDGGTGMLSITGAGTIEQSASNALAVWQGSTVYVDDASLLDLGGSGNYVPGIHVDGASRIYGDGVIDAPIDNEGHIHATDNGTYTLSNGGLLDVEGAVTGTGALVLEPGATLEVDGAVASTQSITFDTGLPETLILGTPGGGLSNAVDNLQDFDRIVLGGVTITGASVTSPGVVTVTTSGPNYVLDDVSFAAGADTTFLTGRDPVSGDDFIQVTCFAEGTRILTPNAEVVVERLRAGDLVLVMENGAPVRRPVRWIGTRSIDLRAHPQPELARPIRILRHACAENVPHRDLLVSPDHAILLDGVLVPARLLVNRASIIREDGLASVRYLHVELDRHSLLLAEGLETESYLDTGNRALFENAGVAMIMHPDLSTKRALRWDVDACAPLATDPARVEPIWRRLADRAAALGYRVPDVANSVDPGLWLEGNATLVSARNGRHVFTLGRGARTVRLRSRAFRPADRRPWLDDRRRLGVPVARIVLQGPAWTQEIAMDDPALTDGWWEAERVGHGLSRWTNGDAGLAVPEATQSVEIRLAGGM